MIDLTKLKHPMAWPQSRKELEKEVLAILRPFPQKRPEPQVKTIDELTYHGYVRRRINYFVDDWNRVAAWLFIPEGKEELPAVLCCHQEVPQGKDETAGLGGDHHLALAQHYAELGYITLAPDCITAGDRIQGRHDAYDTKPFYKEFPKLSLAGKMLVDHMAAMDVFNEFRRVDTARIGVIGHGLGGLNALLLAAFDDRVQACISSCGFTRFETDKQPDRWCPEEGMNLLPKLKACIEKNEYPFDWEHILAMAAPSAMLVISSLSDSPFSNPKSCQKAVNAAAKVYKMLGAASAIDAYMHHDGHRITPETLEIADEWFERWL